MQQNHTTRTHTHTEPYANEAMRKKKVKMNLFYESMRVCAFVNLFILRQAEADANLAIALASSLEEADILAEAIGASLECGRSRTPSPVPSTVSAGVVRVC